MAEATGQAERVVPAEVAPPETPSPEAIRAAATALSRLGASKGGRARAESMSAAKRKAGGGG